MTSESTFNDLRAAIRRLEAEKRRIEERYRALVTTLRYFEDTEGSGGSELQYRRNDNDIPNAIADILAREGPLHRRVIHERLVEMGVRIGGQDPVNNVGAYLSIDPRFRSVGGGIWGLNEPPAPDAKDSPGQSDANAIPGDTSEGSDADHDQHDSEEEEDRVPW